MQKSTGGRPSTDHIVSISMAKELCMMQRNEMGRKFRRYFIYIEQAANSPEKIMERALQIAKERAAEAEKRILAATLADCKEVHNER